MQANSEPNPLCKIGLYKYLSFEKLLKNAPLKDCGVEACMYP